LSGPTPYQAPDLALAFGAHVKAYQESDGQVGHEWNGAHCLILTTTARTSGSPRHNALIYVADGDDYVVVASNAGSQAHPSWYLNLTANPEVQVQVRADRFTARAETVTGEERSRLWASAVAVWPNYDVYTTRTDRELPVVRLRRQPPPSRR
jgi:deazaflavin-dependent oxidoreductase (nitroreductase family)